MTSDNGIAQQFTSHGRPIILGGRIISAEITFDPPAAETPESYRPPNVGNRYVLVGEKLQTIAENLKTYAFAKSAALRWSLTLGEAVSMYRDAGDALVFETMISAHMMSVEEFAAEALAAERGRLVNVINALRENEMDMRATREDAETALQSIDALAALNDVPEMPVAEAARAAAEVYEALEWCVLITGDDADMIGELSAAES